MKQMKLLGASYLVTSDGKQIPLDTVGNIEIQAAITVLVRGGRDYADRERVFQVLDQLQSERPIKAIIHGAASGADRLAGEWARGRLKAEIARPANWRLHGKAAGPIRNSEMLLLKPDMVVAFPGGRGTQDMINQAKRAGIEVWCPRGGEA